MLKLPKIFYICGGFFTRMNQLLLPLRWWSWTTC